MRHERLEIDRPTVEHIAEVRQQSGHIVASENVVVGAAVRPRLGLEKVFGGGFGATVDAPLGLAADPVWLAVVTVRVY